MAVTASAVVDGEGDGLVVATGDDVGVVAAGELLAAALGLVAGELFAPVFPLSEEVQAVPKRARRATTPTTDRPPLILVRAV